MPKKLLEVICGRWRRSATVLLLGSAFTSAALTGPANSDLLDGFNLITGGNFSTTSDTEGAVLVGGNLSGSNTLDTKGLSPTGSMGLYGGINVCGTSAGANYNANGLTVDLAAAKSSSGTFGRAAAVNYSYAFPYSFGTIWSQLTQLSSALSLLPTSAGSSLTGNSITAGAKTLNGVAGVAVLDITAAQFNAISDHLTVNLGSATLLIINVDGSTITPAYNFTGAGYAANVLWNFYDASSVTFGSEFAGSVLAPRAEVTNTNAIDGTLVAEEFTGGGELHWHPLAAPGLSEHARVTPYAGGFGDRARTLRSGAARRRAGCPVAVAPVAQEPGGRTPESRDQIKAWSGMASSRRIYHTLSLWNS